MSTNRIITEMQQSGQVVHVVSARTARSLIKRGLVRATVIQPAPVDGVAVNLTVLGKSWRAKSAAPEPVPSLPQPTETDPQA
jgi:hypothetical protein